MYLKSSVCLPYYICNYKLLSWKIINTLKLINFEKKMTYLYVSFSSEIINMLNIWLQTYLSPGPAFNIVVVRTVDGLTFLDCAQPYHLIDFCLKWIFHYKKNIQNYDHKSIELCLNDLRPILKQYIKVAFTILRLFTSCSNFWVKFTYGIMGLNIKTTNAHNMHNYRLKCTYFLYINRLASFDKNRQFLSKYAWRRI